jgi:hypothetical protein
LKNAPVVVGGASALVDYCARDRRTGGPVLVGADSTVTTCPGKYGGGRVERDPTDV